MFKDWRHWTKGNGAMDDGHAKIDLWPDVSELTSEERMATGHCLVLVGVPAHWRELSGDAVTDAKLLTVIEKADVVSPWTVGRYQSPRADGLEPGKFAIHPAIARRLLGNALRPMP
jgi:hypothetical protein